MGCPNLMDAAYTTTNIDSLLEAGADEYVNHPRGVTIKGAELIVSSIYIWFSEDFGGNDSGIIEHLMNYATPALRKKLIQFNRIADHHYDWSLNDAR